MPQQVGGQVQEAAAQGGGVAGAGRGELPVSACLRSAGEAEGWKEYSSLFEDQVLLSVNDTFRIERVQ